VDEKLDKGLLVDVSSLASPSMDLVGGLFAINSGLAVNSEELLLVEGDELVFERVRLRTEGHAAPGQDCDFSLEELDKDFGYVVKILGLPPALQGKVFREVE